MWFDPKDDVRHAYISLRSIDDSFFRPYTLQLKWREVITKKIGEHFFLVMQFHSILPETLGFVLL